MTKPVANRMNPTTWNDAGLLREYFTEKFGEFCAFGGSPETARRAKSIAARLAAISGKTIVQVYADAREAAAA